MRSPTLRRAALAATCALASLPAALLATPAAQAADLSPRSSILLPVLPDTQFYSRYGEKAGQNLFKPRFGSEPYAAQTQWLADNHEVLDMPFVMHLGDIVDQHDVNGEWDVADEAMQTLERAKLPYSILAGNHDLKCVNCTDADRTPAQEKFLSRFGTARADDQATFVERHSSGFHEAHTFTSKGRTFLVLAMSWQASDDAIAWANDVIADHPTLPVILTTHEILGIADDGVTATDTTYGLKLWDRLIKDNDQIFLTLSGHNHGAAHVRKTNAAGNSVDQILLDYQMAYQGGNAYLGLLELDFTHNRIDTTVVSPWIRQKPASTLIPEYDRVVRPGFNENLSLPIDWNERFESFAPPVTPSEVTHDSLLDRAKASVLRGYTEPEVVTPQAPQGADDYPKVAGTRAHWRFSGQTGTIAPQTGVVEDIAGDNDLTRVALNADTGNTAQADDLKRSVDHAFLSADAGSACFTNTVKKNVDKGIAPRISYLRTAANAPLNTETFPDGYTIESFIKVDPTWTGANAWMGALTRDGRRGDVAGSGGDPDDPVFTLAISSLREVQWNQISAKPVAGASNWSGEIMPDRWIHVAAVNDPATGLTTVYVDGAPVLRNPKTGAGLATAGKPWRLGSATYEGKTEDGWLGCIGETRIVDRPLDRAEWLTARTAAPQPQNPGGGEQPKPEEPKPGTGDGTTTTPTTPAPAPVATTPAPAPAPAPRPVTPPRVTATPLRITSLAYGSRELRVRVNGAGRVRVTLRRFTSATRWSAKATRTFTVTAKRAGTLTIRVPRGVRAGRYRVEVALTSGATTVRRTATVRVR